MEEKKILIKYNDGSREFIFFEDDFERIKYYCLNECMGIQFMVSSEFVIKMVKNLSLAGMNPPFKEEDFLSDKSIRILEETGGIENIKKDFGTDDLSSVLKIAIKQSYNFLHKI